MIVHRLIWVVREGHTRNEAMELWKEFPRGGPYPTRVLGSALLAPQNAMLIFEFEFADLSALQNEWAAFFRDLGGSAYNERWLTVCERNSFKSEVWEVLQ